MCIDLNWARGEVKTAAEQQDLMSKRRAHDQLHKGERQKLYERMELARQDKEKYWHWQIDATPGPELPLLRPIGHAFAMMKKMAVEIVGVVSCATGRSRWY